MKKKILLSVISSLIFLTVFAQQQWRFHIAFEDAIGAKDTIWLVYDTTAHGTLPTDTLLGEGKVNLDYNAFNVFIGNYDNDTTKTLALPYTIYPSHGSIVHAFNYQYPLTISWDTSLFNAPYLPFQQGYFNIARIDNDYFFFQNNLPLEHEFDMLQDDHVSAPAFNWFSQSQFPMTFILYYDPNLGVYESNAPSKSVKTFPNPFQNSITVQSHFGILKSIELISIEDNLIYKHDLSEDALREFTLPTEKIKSGIYFLKITNNLNQIHYEKIIKTD